MNNGIHKNSITAHTAQAGFAFFGSGGMEEKSLYYYHSDHLGSTGYVTDKEGRVSQFVAYLPFGESLYEQHSNTKDMPYLFNGKERDEETGLYYYGARYYDPWSAVWSGVDPMWVKYPTLSPFVYCANNPVIYIDPDGKKIIFVIGKNEYTYNGKNLTDAKGNKVDVPTSHNIGKIIQAYNDVLNSGDEVLANKVKHLIKSDKNHYIEQTMPGYPDNSVSAASSRHSSISEDEKKYKAGERIGTRSLLKMSGDRKADSETIAHEMQHQYDYDIGNMKDHTGKSNAKNPAEIRAVNTENRMKKINNTGKRTTYGGVPINPKSLE